MAFESILNVLYQLYNRRGEECTYRGGAYPYFLRPTKTKGLVGHNQNV